MTNVEEKQINENIETNQDEPNYKATSMLSLGHVTVDSYGGFVAPVMPFIAAKIGITVAAASMVMSIAHLASSIMQPVFGYIADSMKKRFFVVWGLIFAAVFYSLIGVVPNVWFLGAAIVLGALGVGFYHPQATALVGHFSKRQVNLLMSIFTACGTVGFAFGPMSSSMIVGKFGLSALAYAMIPGILIAFGMYFFLPKLEHVKKTAEKAKEPFFSVLKSIFTSKILVVLTLISIIKALMIISFNVYMPFLWEKLGYSVAQIGVAVSALAAMGGIASFIGGAAANVIGRKKVFLLSLLPVTPVALGSLYFVNDKPMVSFVLFALIGFFAMFSVSVNLVVAQMSAPKNKGVVSGIIGGFSWGLVGLCLTPLGYLVHKFGVVNVLYVIAVVPAIGSILISHIPNEYD